MTEQFDTVKDAVAAIAAGRFAVVVDDESRENEGDLVLAAEKATTEAVAFLIRHTSGILCVPMEGRRLDELRVPLMVTTNSEAHGTAFTVSVDLRRGTTTGISAADRALTIRALADPDSAHDDFAKPGHVFPLRYCPGGVLKRAGHTEAATDLARLAGLQPAGVIGEIVDQNGSMARRPALVEFARQHRIPIITIADLVRYRRRHEKLVERVAETRMPTEYGDFRAYAYEGLISGMQHLALVAGDPNSGAPLVRVHSECLTGDAFGSLRCDCGDQMRAALRLIASEGVGVLVYLRGHEGRGIGLAHKLQAYALQDNGLDTVEANLELGLPVDDRRYGVGAQILSDLGVTSMRLMTNNPAKYHGLAGYGLTIAERVSLPAKTTTHNVRYLATKRDKLGHLLDLPDLKAAG